MPALNKNERFRFELKGQNRIGEFRRVAEELVSEISKEENVLGIVLLGGVVRGFVDKSSDLDVTVFLNKKDGASCRKIRNIGLRVAKSHNVDLDLMVHSLDDFTKRRMKEEALKWEYSNARIVLDATGDVKRVLREKLRPSKDFWTRRIAVCGEYIKWYCCPSEEGVGTISESWVERGDLMSAHYCLNYCVDLLLRSLYAINRVFIPAPKWRIFHSYDLEWLPLNYRKLIQEAMTTQNLSREEFNRRLTAIRKIWQEIASKIKEETGLSPRTISKYYVEKILKQ